MPFAISGDTIAVAAYDGSPPLEEYEEIFHRTDGDWIRVKTIPAGGALRPRSLSVDVDTLVVGYPA